MISPHVRRINRSQGLSDLNQFKGDLCPFFLQPVRRNISSEEDLHLVCQLTVPSQTQTGFLPVL